MKSHTIGLLLSSAIMAEGMRVILRQIEGMAVVMVNTDTVDPFKDITLVVADCHTLESVPKDVKAIGINTGLPDWVKARFADIISPYESPEDIRQKVMAQLTPVESDNRCEGLSPREKEVILFIVKGLSNKEIAAQMNVSVNTVMTHRRNIATKLQIHSPAGLTIFAIATGLAKIDELKN